MTIPCRAVVLAMLWGVLVTRSAAAQVACGDTLTADVKLTADLACTGLQALIVGADKITIDLNGFTLSGDDDVGDVGIDNPQAFGGVVIKNGTVSGFDKCINVTGGDKIAITGVTAKSCITAAIDLGVSQQSKVSKSRILGDGYGVRVAGAPTT